jgi:uncharacterized Zn finger protein
MEEEEAGYEEDAEEDAELLENVTLCPNCSTEQDHIILRSVSKGEGVDHLVRCNGCQHVHNVELRPPRSKKLEFTLSEGADSRRCCIEVDADEMFKLGERFDHEEAEWRITRIETGEDKHINHCKAEEVRMIWATRSDRVRVKLTFTEGQSSRSETIICEPDQMFNCGAIMNHQGVRWRIRALHTGQRRKLYGSLPAYRLRRVFLHPPPL